MFTYAVGFWGAKGGGWDITDAVYDNVELSVTAAGNNPTSVVFGDDGNKAYILGSTTDSIYQYNLTTPWDLSTATYSGLSSYLGASSTSPRAVYFKPDGTKMYVADGGTDRVNQYTLSTPWVINTASYDSVNFSILAQDSSTQGLFFKDDGSKMYMVGGSTNSVYEYDLSTNWLVSSASYSGVNFSFASQILVGASDGLFIGDGGSKLYTCSPTSPIRTILQYNLTTDWDLSTIEYNGVSFDASSETLSTKSVYFKDDDGSKMYILDGSLDKVFQYST